MAYRVFVKSQSLVFLLAALYLQTMLTPYLRWFTPDLFFLALLYQALVYKRAGFVMLFSISVFHDVYTGGIIGSSCLALAIVLYLIELTQFHKIRFSFFPSASLIALFYTFYQLLQIIITHGITALYTQSVIFVLATVLATTCTWMFCWKWQASIAVS